VNLNSAGEQSWTCVRGRSGAGVGPASGGLEAPIARIEHQCSPPKTRSMTDAERDIGLPVPRSQGSVADQLQLTRVGHLKSASRR
jgi:hypothetical protein